MGENSPLCLFRVIEKLTVTSFCHFLHENDFQNISKSNPGGIYLFKFNNGNTKTMCEICSKLRTKTGERYHWLGNMYINVVTIFMTFSYQVWDGHY